MGRQVHAARRPLNGEHGAQRSRWSADAIERQLAHAERDLVRAAYNHSDFMDERRKMMQRGRLSGRALLRREGATDQKKGRGVGGKNFNRPGAVHR